MIEPDLSQPMRHNMDLYRARFDAIAADYRAILVPVQAAFDNASSTLNLNNGQTTRSIPILPAIR